MAFPIMAVAYIAKGLSDMGDARAQGVIDKYEAMKAIEIGERMAGNIRREGSAAIGSAVRAMAGSGVSSASGTGALILQDIKRRSEADAMAAALSGKLQAQSIRYKSQQQTNAAAVSFAESIAKSYFDNQKQINDAAHRAFKTSDDDAMAYVGNAKTADQVYSKLYEYYKKNRFSDQEAQVRAKTMAGRWSPYRGWAK